MTDNYEILFGEKDAGIFLGGEATPVSVRTLQRWRLEGSGPTFVKLGKLVRYRRSDLESFLARCCRNSTSENGKRSIENG